MSKELHIGRVIEVTGYSVTGQLEASVDDLYRNHESRRYAVGQVGSIVKIEVGDRLVFGFVTGMRMFEGSDARGPATSTDTKRVDIELFGEGVKTGLKEGQFEFKRGVVTYPLPGQAIRITTINELRRIYQQSGSSTIPIGSLSQAAGLPVFLMTDELLGKHFAILGTTGSGKSCTTALVLRRILESTKGAHVILIDPHGEYAAAFPDLAEPIDPTTLKIPHWMLNFEESVELFIGRVEHAATSQSNILKDAILDAKRNFAPVAIPKDEITVDTPVPYALGTVVTHIKTAMDKLTLSKQESYQKILNKIETLQKDKRYEFLILKDQDVKDEMAALIGRLLRMPANGKPLSILDLSGVPSEIVDVVVSLICRTVFDFCLWSGRPVSVPVLLICEEAHRYAPRSDEAIFKGAKTSLSRIAKEGRKYGVSLGIVSQRPSELDETILSQCNTLFALRMSNDADQAFVKRALPDGVRTLVDELPALRSQEALVVGEGVAVPMRVKLDDLPKSQQPAGQDVRFADLWSNDKADAKFADTVIGRWRKQDRS